LSTALCTFTLIVQVPAGSAVLLKLIVPLPAVAVTVPPQLLETDGVGATTRPEGKLSEKPPLIGTTFPLMIEKPTALGALVATVVGLKLLAMEGGCKIMMPSLAAVYRRPAPKIDCPKS
jgi:hypothetical protein